MTNPVNYQTQQFPAYSGVTINISNPTVNAGNSPYICPQQYPNYMVPNQQSEINQNTNVPNPETTQGLQANQTPVQNPQQPQILTGSINQTTPDTPQQAYPPQYYLNNYNYVQNGEKYKQSQSAIGSKTQDNIEPQPEENMDSSKEIIDDIEARQEEQKKLEENGKKTRVVALTNEYIMSLENYLNNPNTEIRIMASKEILKRLDEDKDRYDDAALNALLNKMLQDPNKLVRIAALSAFSSQLASGNDYTVQLLTNIQQNPDSDKEDVIEAANILLKMSSDTEIKYTPNNESAQAENPVADEKTN